MPDPAAASIGAGRPTPDATVRGIASAGPLVGCAAALLLTACAERDPIAPDPALVLALGVESLDIRQGDSTTLVVTIARSGFAGPVTILAGDPPAGIGIDSVRIAAEESSATLLVAAGWDAPIGTTAVTIRAVADDGPVAEAPLALRIEAPPEPAASCDGPGGTVRAGAASGLWRRVHGPHRLTDTVTVVDSLTIEAGSLVCGAPGAVIAGDLRSLLVAPGTAAQPITFTAAQPEARWGGIDFRTSDPGGGRGVQVRMSHVVLEDADAGIRMGYGQRAELEHAVVRRMGGPAVAVGGLTLRNSVVEAVCEDPDCEAAVATCCNDSYMILEHVVVRGSGGGGVSALAGRSGVELENVRIEGSGGTGLFLGDDAPRGFFTEVTRAIPPIVIQGGQSYPAEFHVGNVPVLLPTLEAQEQWVGNARDTVILRHVRGTRLAEAVIGPRLGWALRGGSSPFLTIGVLRMLPGASLALGQTVVVERMDAQGTAASPVTFRSSVGPGAGHRGGGLLLAGAPADTSRIAHARLDRMIIDAEPAHALVLHDIVGTESFLRLAAPGSRLTRAALRGAFGPGPFASHWHYDELTHPLRVAGRDVLVSDCDISDSQGDGIRTDAADGVVVRDCNIHGNAGVGLRNTAAGAVDARYNWWGDPAGPFGPAGDGVAGMVDFEPFRTAPLPLASPCPLTGCAAAPAAPARPGPRRGAGPAGRPRRSG
jgi:hypothetical protein